MTLIRTTLSRTMNLWAPLYAALFLTPSRTVVGFHPTIRKISLHQWAPRCILTGVPTQTSTSRSSKKITAWNMKLPRQSSSRRFSSFGDDFDPSIFTPGSKVQVEVVSFGPLGASVNVIGLSHDSAAILPEGEEPYSIGLIYQNEIAYFRSARNNVDVVRGEILPAYVQKVRDDGKVDIGLRAFGGKQKSLEVSEQIMEQLEDSPDGILEVGDKSSPADINRLFPGVSKTAFKKAVGALYKKGLITPSPTSISINE